MRRALALAVRFTAQALVEALARRGDTPGTAYAPAAEIERLTGELSALDDTSWGLDPGGEAARARMTLDAHLETTPDDPLARLERGLLLNRTERDVLRALIAATLEPRVGTLVGHLQDALQRTRPTPAVLAQLLHDPAAVAVALSPSRPLRRDRVTDAEHAGPDASMGLDPRLFAYAVSGDLPPFDTAAGSCALCAAIPLPAAACARAATIAAGASLVVRGPPGSGRRSLARAMAAREGRPALLVDVRSGDALPLVQTALRDARILGARLVVAGALDEPAAEALVAEDVPLALVLDPDATVPAPLLTHPFVPLALGVPSVEERAALFREALGDRVPESAIHEAAERYAFTPGRITQAAAQAHTHGLDAACRLQLRHHLDHVAVCQLSTSLGWDRLVLPAPTLETLQAVASQVKHRARVLDGWGFGRHHALGHGVKALFFGKSGTGKTLAAEVLASELSLPLYRLDVSRVVSKWIGETEKNLARVFEEAREACAILFFDEADSLFGRRTAIQSATDRYANMEVNDLLQRIEAYEGVILLATNLKANMDEAFARRLHHVVEFPEPDEAARERIWRISMPEEAPVGEDVDFGVLARKYELSGGAIRNAVVGAAFRAAEGEGVIRMGDLVGAVREEYRKGDRLFPRG